MIRIFIFLIIASILLFMAGFSDGKIRNWIYIDVFNMNFNHKTDNLTFFILLCREVSVKSVNRRHRDLTPVINLFTIIDQTNVHFGLKAFFGKTDWLGFVCVLTLWNWCLDSRVDSV